MEDNLYRQAIVISKPSAEAYEFIPSEDLILSLGGKHPLRNIFSVSQYLDFEYEKLKRLKEIYALKKIIMPKAPHNTSQYLMDLHPVIEFNSEELLGSTRDYIEEFLEVLVLPD